MAIENWKNCLFLNLVLNKSGGKSSSDWRPHGARELVENIS